MKKILLILSIIAFTNFAFGQTLDAVSKTDTQSVMNDKSVQDKITKQIISNEDLANQALAYLKNNPETKARVKKYSGDSDGTVGGIMKSLMTDTKISSTIMDWVSNNPEVYSQVMGLIGM